MTTQIPRRSVSPPPPGHLTYPTEATTESGLLVTVERYERDGGGWILHGYVWPLGERRIKAAWRDDGRAIAGPDGAHIVGGSYELAEIMREVERHAAD